MAVLSQAFVLMSCLTRVMYKVLSFFLSPIGLNKYSANFTHIWPFKFPFPTVIFIVIIFEWLNQ